MTPPYELDGPLVLTPDGKIIGQWRQRLMIEGRGISVPLHEPWDIRKWQPENDPPIKVAHYVARFDYRKHDAHGYVLVLVTDTPEIRKLLAGLEVFKVLW